MGCTGSKASGPMEETSLIKGQEDVPKDDPNLKDKEVKEEKPPEPRYLVPFQDWTPPDWTPPLEDDEEGEGKLGEVYLTVHHIPSNHQVAVRLMRARHLRRRGDSADIQFAMTLSGPSGKKEEQKSTIKKATIDPVLDERFFWDLEPGVNGEDTVLRIVANDLSITESPYVGEIVIGIGRMGFGLLNPAWIPLRKSTYIPIIETPPPEEESHEKTGIEIPSFSAMAGSMAGMGRSLVKNIRDVEFSPPKDLHIPHFSSPKMDLDAFSVAQTFMSSASNASTSVIVKKQEYGKVYLSLFFKYPQNTLEIAVVSAQLNRTSSPAPNPYVKIKVLPDPSGKNGKQKTKAQKGTLEPFFNESFNVQIDKKESQKLQVSVWSNEVGKNPFLGEALINLSSLPVNEAHKDWFPLESLTHGELNCHMTYDHQSDALNITIIKARDLLGSGSSIDPYVKLYILPDPKKSSKRKTKCKKGNLNPEFNESFRFFLPEFDNAHQKFLHLSVLNHNSIGHQDPVGFFSIPIQEIIEAQTIERWFPLIRDRAVPERPGAKKEE